MIVGGLDLESTGVRVDTDRICELALILQDIDSGVERLSYVRRINPQMHIAAGATKIHGITDADVIGEPIFPSVAPLLLKILDRCDIVVGHNIIGFDLMMLLHEMSRCGATITKQPVIFDTMLEGRWATSDGKFPTLGELCWALNVEYDPKEAHAAKYDVVKTLECFRKGLEIGAYKLPEKKES